MAWRKDWTLGEAKKFYNKQFGYPELDVEEEGHSSELGMDLELSPNPVVEFAVDMQMEIELPELQMLIELSEFRMRTNIQFAENPLYIDFCEYATDVNDVKLGKSKNIEPNPWKSGLSMEQAGVDSPTNLVSFTDKKREGPDQYFQFFSSTLNPFQEFSATKAKETSMEIANTSKAMKSKLGTMSPAQLRKSSRTSVMVKKPAGYYKVQVQLRKFKPNNSTRRKWTGNEVDRK